MFLLKKYDAMPLKYNLMYIGSCKSINRLKSWKKCTWNEKRKDDYLLYILENDVTVQKIYPAVHYNHRIPFYSKRRLQSITYFQIVAYVRLQITCNDTVFFPNLASAWRVTMEREGEMRSRPIHKLSYIH